MTEGMKKFSSGPAQDGEGLIVIPLNYAEEGIVPIAIRSIDDRGRAVFPGWIAAVPPVADPLRNLARHVLGDVWRVSELTESSVHALSATHGERLGYTPSTRVYADACWRARDLAAGGRRARTGRDVSLKDELLAIAKDPHDFAKAFEDRELINRLEERLKGSNQTEVLIMLQMYLSESEDQIASFFGAKRNSRTRNRLTQRFRRGIREVLKLL